MLDHLRLAIPVFPVHAVERGQGNFFFEGNLLELGLNCGARVVRLDDDGNAKPYDLYAPYDSLGTDFSDMAIKFYHNGRNTLPYVELKASPIKLLQGHNVYGSDDIEQGALEMLGLLTEAFPKLCAYLDFNRTEVFHLDCTYMTKLPNQSMVQPVIDYFANIQTGHIASSGVQHNNYVLLSKKDSRYLGRKIYGKFLQLQEDIDGLLKRQAKGKLSKQEHNRLTQMQSVLDFAEAKLRFEARICKTYLAKNNYPTNLFKLIELQRQKPDLLQQLWGCAFNPIFETLKGESMMLNNDDKVKELLRAKLFTVTKNGNLSYRKANAVYQFYKTVKSDGYQKVRADTPKNTFYDNVRALVFCGISKAHLQNLHTQKPKVIPIHRLIELDFNNQVPKDFVAPVSRFNKPKAQHLRLVA